MCRLRNTAGLVSMVEVIVTSIIFTLTITGVFIAMTSTQPKAAVSTKKLNAAYAAKGFLDELRHEVRADMWVSGSLGVGAYNQTVDGYAVQYTVTDVPGLMLRQVDLTITY